MNERRPGPILIVEDVALISWLLSVTLEQMGFEVCGVAVTAEEAVQLADAHQPVLVLMDVRLRGDRDGVDAAKEIHRRRPTRVIFITGSPEPETLRRIDREHPAEVLIKPILPEQLQAAVARVLN